MGNRCTYTDTVNISISIDPQTKSMIDEIQIKDQRSRSWIICDCIKEYYQHHIKSDKLDST